MDEHVKLRLNSFAQIINLTGPCGGIIYKAYFVGVYWLATQSTRRRKRMRKQKEDARRIRGGRTSLTYFSAAGHLNSMRANGGSAVPPKAA